VEKNGGEMQLVVGRDLAHERINSLVRGLEWDNRRAKLPASYAPENIRVVDASQVPVGEVTHEPRPAQQAAQAGRQEAATSKPKTYRARDRKGRKIRVTIPE
jgi:hypothetical protein